MFLLKYTLVGKIVNPAICFVTVQEYSLKPQQTFAE